MANNTDNKIDETMLLMMAYNVLQSLPKDSSIKDKVLLLSRFDLSHEQIAKVCGTTAKNVSNYRAEVKKNGKK